VNKGPIQVSICFKLVPGLLVLGPLSKVALKISIVKNALHLFLGKKYILFSVCFENQHLRTLNENSVTDESLRPNWIEKHMKA
jgi:hypothetical protein